MRARAPAAYASSVTHAGWRATKTSAVAHNDPITSLMTPDPETVDVRQKISDVRRLMARKRFHHVPVVNGRRLVGMLSATDMMRLSMAAYGASEQTVDAMLDAQFSIQEVMTTGVFTVHREETVRHAADRLRNGAFHSLPVVDDDGNVVGIITSSDLIQYLYDLL